MTEHMENKWKEYLANLSNEPVGLSIKHAQSVRDLWRKIESTIADVPLPIASMGGELGFQLAWNTERFYLDIDIAESGEYEWFFFDRKIGLCIDGSKSKNESLVKNEIFECFTKIVCEAKQSKGNI
jgi:hypothetical protein